MHGTKSLPKADSVGYSLNEDEYMYYKSFGFTPTFRSKIKSKYSGDIREYLEKSGYRVVSIKNYGWESTTFFIDENESRHMMIVTSVDGKDEKKRRRCEVFADSEEKLELLHTLMEGGPKLVNNSEVGILRNEYGELMIDYIDIPIPNFDLALNYGASFVETNQIIKSKLGEGKKGLYLLYGDPGTGKTTYLRYLMNTLKRKMIIIPNNLIGQLDGPALVSLLMNHKKSILIIEDSESVLQSREEGNNVAPTIINMTDGIVGDILEVAIIATFNVKKSTIDAALLRKGRLHFEHEFKALSVRDSQALLDDLGIPHKTKKGMTLADIYNLQDDNGHNYEENKEKKIGFVK